MPTVFPVQTGIISCTGNVPRNIMPAARALACTLVGNLPRNQLPVVAAITRVQNFMLGHSRAEKCIVLLRPEFRGVKTTEGRLLCLEFFSRRFWQAVHALRFETNMVAVRPPRGCCTQGLFLDVASLPTSHRSSDGSAAAVRCFPPFQSTFARDWMRQRRRPVT